MPKKASKKTSPAGSLKKTRIKPVLTCPSCQVENDDYVIIKKDEDGHTRKCGTCGWKFNPPKRTKSTTRRKRKEDPRGIVPPTEPSFVRPNDPEQEKLLTKIQGFLRNQGSRSSVLPYLGLLTETARLRVVETDLLKQVGDIRAAIEMAEGTKLYKTLAKAKADEPLPAKDAFKFT